MTILYTMMGGITAVIWTDVLQMLMMFAGIAVALVVLFGALPSEVAMGDVVYIGGIQQMWTSIDLSWDPTNTYTLWSGLIGGVLSGAGLFWLRPEPGPTLSHGQFSEAESACFDLQMPL